MAITIDEKILSVCKLRYDKNNTEKNHTCYLTPTKLYITRGQDVKNVSLQDISSVEYTRRVNWKLVGFGILIVLFALTNYKLGIFPSKPEYTSTLTSQKNWLAQSDSIILHGLNIDQQPQTQTDASDQLPPYESIVQGENTFPLSPIPDLEEMQNWEESKNNISMAIAMIGGILIYVGFKKKSFIHIITNRENIYLRVYIVTEEYESFVNMLNKKIGYVGINNK